MTRLPAVFDKQRKRIEAFLCARFDLEDAAATASRGYARGRLPAPHQVQTRDPSTVKPFRSQYDVPADQRPAPRSEPRWVRDVVAVVSKQPRHLRELVPAGLSELRLEHRIVVYLHGTQGLSFRQIAAWQGKMLGLGKSTAERRWAEAVRFLVEWVYDDDDQIRWTREGASWLCLRSPMVLGTIGSPFRSRRSTLIPRRTPGATNRPSCSSEATPPPARCKPRAGGGLCVPPRLSDRRIRWGALHDARGSESRFRLPEPRSGGPVLPDPRRIHV